MLSNMKKFVMKQKWRIQQIGSFANTILLVVAVAGVYNEPLQKVIPVRSLFLIPLIALIALGTVMFAGWVWDKGLKLWHDEQVVAAERNPYMITKLAPVSRKYCLPVWILTGDYVAKIARQLGISAEELEAACNKARILEEDDEEDTIS